MSQRTPQPLLWRKVLALTCTLAAELHVGIWCIVLGHVLQQAGTGDYDQPFGPASAVLARALQLASVCTLWREAAVHAARSLPELDLYTHRNLQPQYLSPLLAALVAGRRSMRMDSSLFDWHLARFLELTGIVELTLCGWWTPYEDEAGWLGSWTTLRRLSVLNYSPGLVWDGIMPSAFPNGLQSLTMSFGGSPVHHEAGELLERLQGLPALAELHLAFLKSQDLPEHIPHLPLLRRLTVSFQLGPDTQSVSLPALQRAMQGVSLVLEVRITSSDSDQGYICPRSAERARVWAALAQVPSLQELHLYAHASYGVHEPASPVETGLLGRVCCKELVLHGDTLLAPFAAHLLSTVACETVLARQRFDTAAALPLEWSCLTAKLGVFVIELRKSATLAISGCQGTMPVFEKAWALVLVSTQQDNSISGVPKHLFQPGPWGCLVWRNSSVTDACLIGAFTKLRVKCS